MSKTELLNELESISFPVSTRNNIKRSGHTQYGFVLGKVRMRGSGLKYNDKVVRDSNRTSSPKYARVYELAKAVIKKAKPDFKFNSIQFNKNGRTAKHVDGNNVGVSAMLGLGDYTGGDIFIYNEDGNNPKKVKTKNRWVTFNGSKLPHETEKFSGTRYTLVYYNT